MPADVPVDVPVDVPWYASRCASSRRASRCASRSASRGASSCCWRRRWIRASEFFVSPSDNLQMAINLASSGDTIVLGSGRFDQSVIINKAVNIVGANYGISVHADNDDTVSDLF